MDISSIIEVITKTINTLFQNLFSSVDNNIYGILDDITFINKDFLSDKFTERLLGLDSFQGIILIANALLVGMAVYYAARYLFSIYGNGQVERPYQFIFKMIIITICVNSSYFICEQIIQINFYISGAIRAVGENLLNTNISFEELILKLNKVFYNDAALNIFSFDGMIKSFTSFGLLNLVFSYSLRYIMLKLFVLMTPIMMITLLNNSTAWIFKSWIKSVISLLFVQSIIALILLLIFSTTFTENSVFSKLMYIGSIYALIKANSYTAQIFGGIATDVGVNISNLKNVIK